MTTGLTELGAFAQHTIKFVHQQSHRFVALVGRHRGVHVRSVDLDVTFRREAVGDILLGIALQLHTHTYDAFLVSEQSVHFVVDKLLQRRGQFEVNTGDDEIVCLIHDYFGIWVYLGQK